MPRHKILRSPRLRRKERQRKIKRISLFSFLFLAAILGILYEFSKPEFRIRSVEVSGSKQVSKERIQNVATAAMNGMYLWFIPKAHTLLYPKSALKESIMREFPALSGVSLSLGSLSALRVFVYEREPQALWCASREECFLIDETGLAFALAEPGMEQMYYRFEKKEAKTPLGREVISQERFKALLRFFKELETAGFPPKGALIKERGELEVTLDSGARLLLRDGDFDTALINLKTLLEQDDLLSKNGGKLSVDYIDLRYGNKIYFKPH